MDDSSSVDMDFVDPGKAVFYHGRRTSAIPPDIDSAGGLVYSSRASGRPGAAGRRRLRREAMDAVFLARLQFGLTAGFHFLFPPTTLGLTLIIVVVETLYRRTKNGIYKDLSIYLVKILGTVFVLGVATGIVLEFAFGNNWAAYSRTVGDIFGAPLAAEAVFSFFLESVFLGILVFGRNRVSAEGLPALGLPRLPRRASVGAVDHHRQFLDADAGRLPYGGGPGRPRQLLEGGL